MTRIPNGHMPRGNSCRDPQQANERACPTWTGELPGGAEGHKQTEEHFGFKLLMLSPYRQAFA